MNSLREIPPSAMMTPKPGAPTRALIVNSPPSLAYFKALVMRFSHTWRNTIASMAVVSSSGTVTVLKAKPLLSHCNS